jgi:hypothetical protein
MLTAPLVLFLHTTDATPSNRQRPMRGLHVLATGPQSARVCTPNPQSTEKEPQKWDFTSTHDRTSARGHTLTMIKRRTPQLSQRAEQQAASRHMVSNDDRRGSADGQRVNHPCRREAR